MPFSAGSSLAAISKSFWALAFSPYPIHDDAAHRIGSGHFWIKLDQLVEILQGSLGVADRKSRHPSVEKRGGILGIDLNRLGEIVDGAGRISHLLPGHSPVDKRRGKGMRESTGSVGVVESKLKIA